jgi:hypothetical protein
MQEAALGTDSRCYGREMANPPFLFSKACAAGSGARVTLPLRELAALVGAASIFASGCVETFDGNGVPADESRPSSGFDRVTSRGPLDVAITQGDFAVGVHIDQNLLSRIGTTVSGDTLIIQAEGGNLGDIVAGPHITIAMPSLVGAEMRGTGTFTVDGFDE